jgi:uncharacterized delta-60 repeat protein
VKDACRTKAPAGTVAVLGALLIFGVSAAQTAPGRLDPHFGSRGKVRTKIGLGSGAAALAIQPDGKIVTAGYGGRSPYHFAVARFDANGQLDPAFGSHGTVITSIGPADGAFAVGLQHDHKVVVAGVTDDGVNIDIALARYTARGSLDPSFGSGGLVTTRIGGEPRSAVARALAIQPDGKIVIAGSAGSEFLLARYDANGSLDTSFGNGGIVTTSIGMDDVAFALALQADRKIVVAGDTGLQTLQFALARFNANGSLDTSFGAGGRLRTAITGFDGAHAVTVESDGKILAAGESARTHGIAPWQFALVRYRRDGSPDSTFGNDGVVTIPMGSGAFAEAQGLVVGRSGKITAAGTATQGEKLDFALIRLKPSGTLDRSFGVGGRVMTSFSAGNDLAYGLALQRDGKIVLAGTANEGASAGSGFALARYLGSFTCRVPDVRGTGLERAKRAIVRAHCVVGRITRAYSRKIGKGRVISQQPKSGVTRPAKARVNVVVSRGNA